MSLADWCAIALLIGAPLLLALTVHVLRNAAPQPLTRAERRMVRGCPLCRDGAAHAERTQP